MLAAVANVWTISVPQYSNESGGFTFCGIQVEQTWAGLEIHQQSYIQGLLDKYPEVKGSASQPLLKEPDQTDAPVSERSLEKLRLGQKLVGEILWVSTRTRPDLAYPTSRLGQMLVKDIDFAITAGYELLRYLRGTAHYRIRYGAPRVQRSSLGPWQGLTPNTLELFADASFCAGTDRSQSGMILQWNDAPVAWLSLRQPTASLSTAEAELQSSIDCMTLAEGFTDLLRELEGVPIKCILYGDNQGAVTVLQIPQGAWRTRHLRLKAAWFLQQVEDQKYPVYHVPGQFMLGDLCTKTLTGPRVRELLALIGIVVDNKGESVAVGLKNLSLGSGGVSIKPDGATSSESTSELRGCGADSGGVVQPSEEPIDTFTDSGEDAVSSPVIPNMSLLKRGLQLLVAALCLKRSQGKIVITIEEENDVSGRLVAWLLGLFVALGTLLVGVACCGTQSWCPRIRSMRAGDVEEPEDWTVLSSVGSDEGRASSDIPQPCPGGDEEAAGSAGLRVRRPHGYRNQGGYNDVGHREDLRTQGTPQAQGLSRSTPRARTMIEPDPQFPRRYLNPPRDEDFESQGHPQAQGSRDSPARARTSAGH